MMYKKDGQIKKQRRIRRREKREDKRETATRCRKGDNRIRGEEEQWTKAVK